MFSIVTMPTVPPYSSTTIARCACLTRKRLSNFSSDIISGTGMSSRLIFIRSGLRIAHQRHQLLDVDQADRVIEMPAAKRKAGVPRFERLLHVLIEALLDIEINHFAARRHDIAHHAAAHVERVDQDVAADGRDFVRLFALIEDEAQLFFAVRQLGCR